MAGEENLKPPTVEGEFRGLIGLSDGRTWRKFTTKADVKEAVRARAGYRCEQCGRTNAENLQMFGGRLDVHRLRPGSRYSVDDCVALCRLCHGAKPKTPATCVFTTKAGKKHVLLDFSKETTSPLKRARISAGLTVLQVAARVGVSGSHVHECEKAGITKDHSLAGAYCKALGVPLTTIVGPSIVLTEEESRQITPITLQGVAEAPTTPPGWGWGW